MAKQKIRIIPLGGLGEVGKNMSGIEWGKGAIIIDTGVMFPANDMLGVDLIIPGFRYRVERKDLPLHGILYTHRHEDHTGAAPYLVDALRGVPLYATPADAALLAVELRDARLHEATNISVFTPGDSLNVGPFSVESFHTTHRIPVCVGVGITPPYA